MKVQRAVQGLGALGALIMLMGVNVASGADLATVNGQALSDKDLKAALSGLNDSQREGVLKDPAARRQVLNTLIDQEILIDQAKKEKLDQDQEFKEAVQAFQKQYLASRVLAKNLTPKLTDAAAKKYYEVNRPRYSTDLVQAQHILLADEAKAREILKLAKASGADFQDLAEKNSKDPSAKNNRGDLGFFGRDRMVPEFTEAAFGANEGEIVGPVKTAFGYHIIKIIKKRPGKALEYDEVELRVKNDMRQEYAQQYVNKLRTGAKVQINDKAVEQPGKAQ